MERFIVERYRFPYSFAIATGVPFHAGVTTGPGLPHRILWDRHPNVEEFEKLLQTRLPLARAFRNPPYARIFLNDSRHRFAVSNSGKRLPSCSIK